jgi:hypothetical protein
VGFAHRPESGGGQSPPSFFAAHGLGWEITEAGAPALSS